MTGYSAAKAAVIALTKSLGKELASTEIRDCTGSHRHSTGCPTKLLKRASEDSTWRRPT